MIELLKAISEAELREKVKEFVITHENIDDAYKKYSYGFLDVFNHCLSQEEASSLLCSFTTHNLKNEQNFIEFMRLVFDLNDNEPLFVNMPFHEIDSADILHFLNMLDYADRITFIEYIRGSRIKSTYYEVVNYEQLQLLTKLATRELYFPVFYFTKLPMILVGNFELSLPLFCSDKENMSKYKTIAERCGLFIRNIVEKDAID